MDSSEISQEEVDNNIDNSSEEGTIVDYSDEDSDSDSSEDDDDYSGSGSGSGSGEGATGYYAY